MFGSWVLQFSGHLKFERVCKNKNTVENARQSGEGKNNVETSSGGFYGGLRRNSTGAPTSSHPEPEPCSPHAGCNGVPFPRAIDRTGQEDAVIVILEGRSHRADPLPCCSFFNGGVGGGQAHHGLGPEPDIISCCWTFGRLSVFNQEQDLWGVQATGISAAR